VHNKRGYMKKYENTFDFIKDMKIGKKDNSLSTSDFLWKFANYRFNGIDKEDYKGYVLDYMITKQTRLNGLLVAPIVMNKKGSKGYFGIINGNSDDIEIMMTKEEVDIFNYNFADKDYEKINRFAVLGC